MRSIRAVSLRFACIAVGAIASLFGGHAQAQGAAPELEPNLGWLNTDQPLKLSDQLKGHVVLLDFWTYCCINCMHVIPDLEYLESKYADQPFIIVGVHSAKFQNESTRESIRNAIFRYHLRHPVVIDKEFAIWKQYAVESWPTLVLIGADGRILGEIAGEGQRRALDEAVRRALEDARANSTLAAKKFEPVLDAGVPSTSGLAFPGKVHAQAPSESHPGRLFIADSSHNRVLITTWPGDDAVCSLLESYGSPNSGFTDGDAATARFNDPQGMALDPDRDVLYIADTKNHSIRAIDLSKGAVTTVAGNGALSNDRSGGKFAKAQGMNSPWDLALSPDHFNLYLAMAGDHQIWSLQTVTMKASRLAGSGREDIMDGPAITCALAQPSGLALSSDARTLYFADAEVSAVRALDLERKSVSTLIGKGLFVFGDVDGDAFAARLQHCLGVTLLPTAQGDRILVADTYNHKIKLVNPADRSAVSWLGAGRGVAASESELRLDEPGGLYLCKSPAGAAESDRLFIADTNNHRIVMVDPGSRAWREVMISGLMPGATPISPPPGAIEATITAALGRPLSLSLSADLRAHAKLNTEAPVSIRVSRLSEGRAPVVAQRTLRADHFPVTIDVPAQAVTAHARLLVELSYAACDESASLCAPGDAAWIVRVEAGEASNASLSPPAR